MSDPFEAVRPRTKKLGLWVTQEDYDALRRLAKQKKVRSVAAVAYVLLQAAMKNQGIRS